MEQREFADKLRELTVLRTTRIAQKTNPKRIGSKNQAQSAEEFKQRLKTQRPTRRAQKGKQKLNTKKNKYAKMQKGTKRHAWGSEKPRTMCTRGEVL